MTATNPNPPERDESWMQTTDANDAADIIWRNWQAGTVIDALPGHLRPRNRIHGYAIQAHLAARSDRPTIGWKIAATSKAGQTHIGVDGPLAGRLLAERTFGSGATLTLAHNRMLVAEPEFAFRAGRPLPPRPEPYTVSEVVGAMDALLPAIEVPDSRFADFVAAGGAQLIADNACAHEFVLGEPAPASWRSIDLANHVVRCSLGTRLSRDGIGANVLGDPRVALTWLVNELSGLGLTLEQGQIVTTGACATPLPIEPGDHMRADFGMIGSVEARFA